MARKKARKEVKEAEVPISSMIDIVFLLIIFFVVTAAIDKEIEDEKVLLANAPHGKPVAEKDPRTITINVRSDGTLSMGLANASLENITNTIKKAAAKYGNDIPIVIRGDADAQHEYIKRVMEAVTNTRLYRIKFNAEIKEGK